MLLKDNIQRLCNFLGFDAMAVKLWENVHLSFGNSNMKFDLMDKNIFDITGNYI